MSESSPGQIVTFYSYKGGTGRTMAARGQLMIGTSPADCSRATPMEGVGATR